MSADEPHYLGHRERLRERFPRAGAVGLADYELLELLLTYALPRRDTKPIAKALLARFGSLAAVLEASASDLAATDGLGERSASLIGLVRALGIAYLAARAGGAGAPANAPPSAPAPGGTTQVQEVPALYPAAGASNEPPPAVVELARAELAGRPEEALLVLYLDGAQRLLGHQLLSLGAASQVAVSVRQVVREALARQARALVLAHNHPSGVLVPSGADLVTTHALQQAAGLLDIHLLDHLIVGPQGSYSLAAHGLIRPSK